MAALAEESNGAAAAATAAGNAEDLTNDKVMTAYKDASSVVNQALSTLVEKVLYVFE